MRTVVAALTLALTAAAAQAQPAIPPSPPPSPPLVLPPPPPSYLPPRYEPALASDWAELARRGREKKLAGAALMGIGSAVAVVGAAILVDGLYQANGSRWCDAYRCGVNGEAAFGGVAVAIGTAAAVAGIPVWAVGVHQSRQALRLRYRLAVAPGGAALSF